MPTLSWIKLCGLDLLKSLQWGAARSDFLFPCFAANSSGPSNFFQTWLGGYLKCPHSQRVGVHIHHGHVPGAGSARWIWSSQSSGPCCCLLALMFQHVPTCLAAVSFSLSYLSFRVPHDGQELPWTGTTSRGKRADFWILGCRRCPHWPHVLPTSGGGRSCKILGPLTRKVWQPRLSHLVSCFTLSTMKTQLNWTEATRTLTTRSHCKWPTHKLYIIFNHL